LINEETLRPGDLVLADGDGVISSFFLVPDVVFEELRILEPPRLFRRLCYVSPATMTGTSCLW